MMCEEQHVSKLAARVRYVKEELENMAPSTVFDTIKRLLQQLFNGISSLRGFAKEVGEIERAFHCDSRTKELTKELLRDLCTHSSFGTQEMTSEILDLYDGRISFRKSPIANLSELIPTVSPGSEPQFAGVQLQYSQNEPLHQELSISDSETAFRISLHVNEQTPFSCPLQFFPTEEPLSDVLSDAMLPGTVLSSSFVDYSSQSISGSQTTSQMIMSQTSDGVPTSSSSNRRTSKKGRTQPQPDVFAMKCTTNSAPKQYIWTEDRDAILLEEKNANSSSNPKVNFRALATQFYAKTGGFHPPFKELVERSKLLHTMNEIKKMPQFKHIIWNMETDILMLKLAKHYVTVNKSGLMHFDWSSIATCILSKANKKGGHVGISEPDDNDIISKLGSYCKFAFHYILAGIQCIWGEEDVLRLERSVGLQLQIKSEVNWDHIGSQLKRNPLSCLLGYHILVRQTEIQAEPIQVGPFTIDINDTKLLDKAAKQVYRGSKTKSSPTNLLSSPRTVIFPKHEKNTV